MSNLVCALIFSFSYVAVGISGRAFAVAGCYSVLQEIWLAECVFKITVLLT